MSLRGPSLYIHMLSNRVIIVVNLPSEISPSTAPPSGRIRRTQNTSLSSGMRSSIISIDTSCCETPEENSNSWRWSVQQYKNTNYVRTIIRNAYYHYACEFNAPVALLATPDLIFFFADIPAFFADIPSGFRL